MAQQQQIILAEFIEKVKRDNYRKDDPYLLDDDSAITTNRGNKLNRNAKFVRRGRLNNHAQFQQTIDHAGYKRDVISINPQYYNPDGELIEDEDDIDDEDEPLDENIYKDIKLEELMAPLASAADLPSHPSMSIPYKERGLDEMIEKAEEQLHKQQDILFTIKNIYTTFVGDNSWAPMGTFRDAEGQRILNLGNVEATATENADMASVNGTAAPSLTNATEGQEQLSDVLTAQEGGANAEQDLASTNGVAQDDDAVQSIERTDHASLGAAVVNGNGSLANGTTTNGMDFDATALSEAGHTNDSSMEDADSTGPSHRMTTRRQAHESLPASPIPQVSPFFSFPSSARPSTTMGLPSQMVEDTKIALPLYISKQEEIVRQLRDLHNGLLKAKKMRDEVWKWTRAEGHTGEMSDNEDWVDFEEWGIDPRDGRIKYTKGQQEEDQVDEEEERRGKRVRRAGRLDCGLRGGGDVAGDEGHNDADHGRNVEGEPAEVDDANDIDEGAANLLELARRAFEKESKSTTSITKVNSDISYSNSDEEDDNGLPNQDAGPTEPKLGLPTPEVVKIVPEDYVVDVAYLWSKQARHPDVVAKKFESMIAKHVRKAAAREKRQRAHYPLAADEEANTKHVPCADEEQSVEPPTSAPKDKGKGRANPGDLPSEGEDEQDHDPEAAHARDELEDDEFEHDQGDDDDGSDFEANIRHSASRGDTNRQLRSEGRDAEAYAESGAWDSGAHTPGRGPPARGQSSGGQSSRGQSSRDRSSRVRSSRGQRSRGQRSRGQSSRGFS